MKQRHEKHCLAVLLVALPLPLAACAASSAGSGGDRPAVVERLAQSDSYRITLSPETVKRLQIRMTKVTLDGKETVVPYSAVFYSANGRTWTYVRQGLFSFTRRAVTVDRIAAATAFVANGLSAGSQVVTKGVAELHGIETSAGARA